MHPVWNHIKFVTGNVNKVREAEEILGINLEQIELSGLFEIQTNDIYEIVKNKVEQAYKLLKCPVMVEDSGLVFSAWNGLPGGLVKWFELTVGCAGMLKMLESFENRKATALCYVAIHDGREIKIAKGEIPGSVAREIRGVNGFGWDVIFIPDGHCRTYAEMDSTEKNAISHRNKALEALKEMMSV